MRNLSRYAWLHDAKRDLHPTDSPSLVGDVCHIKGEKPSSARHDPDLAKDELHTYANLIVLCKVHHKVIDDQPGEYTVECVRDMKRAHEEWVRTQLASFDAARQRDEEYYAAIIQEWEKRARGRPKFFLDHLDHLRAMAERVLASTRPSMIKAGCDAPPFFDRWTMGNG
jgi:hypothetical protein